MASTTRQALSLFFLKKIVSIIDQDTLNNIHTSDVLKYDNLFYFVFQIYER
jgi:hypothetical protein